MRAEIQPCSYVLIFLQFLSLCVLSINFLLIKKTAKKASGSKIAKNEEQPASIKIFFSMKMLVKSCIL